MRQSTRSNRLLVSLAHSCHGRPHCRHCRPTPVIAAPTPVIAAKAGIHGSPASKTSADFLLPGPTWESGLKRGDTYPATGGGRGVE